MKKQALLVGLTAVALFAGIGGLQSKGPQSTVGAPADEQTTREIAEQINQRHAARMHFDQNAYSVFVDRSAVFAEPG